MATYAVITTREGTQPNHVNNVDVLGPFDTESEAREVARQLAAHGEAAAVKPIMPAWAD